MISKSPEVVRWSKEFYYQMGELGWFDGKRVELIDGEIYEMSPIGSRHATAVTLTTRLLDRINPDDFFVYCQNPFNAGRKSEPVPDICVIAGNARAYSHSLPETPALVVEVADSSLRYDRTVKAKLYAASGVPEYWILDVVGNELTVYMDPELDTNGQYSYANVSSFDPDAEVRPRFAPETAVRVSDLLP